PRAAARKSARCLSRSIEPADARAASRAQPLAAAGAPGGDHLAAPLGRHAGAKTVSALAHQLARLIGPLHGWFSAARKTARKYRRSSFRWGSPRLKSRGL